MLDTAIPLPYWFELAAVLTGGISGAMSAVRERFDIFGCLTIAFVTGLGGGVTRDILLQDYGIYAFQNPTLIICCAIAAVLVFYFGKLATYLDPIVDLLDNISVALWAIIGTAKSLSAGLDIVPAIVLGTITATGGGILRDVLLSRKPEAFQAGALYGSAALIGCIAYAVMRAYNILPAVAAIVCAVFIMGLRYGSLIFGWRTKPARDYSDTVTRFVAKPVKFIARKVNVPVGKTARDREAARSPRHYKVIRFLHQLNNRISGRWQQADANDAFIADPDQLMFPPVRGEQGKGVSDATAAQSAARAVSPVTRTADSPAAERTPGVSPAAGNISGISPAARRMSGEPSASTTPASPAAATAVSPTAKTTLLPRIPAQVSAPAHVSPARVENIVVKGRDRNDEGTDRVCVTREEFAEIADAINGQAGLDGTRKDESGSAGGNVRKNERGVAAQTAESSDQTASGPETGSESGAENEAKAENAGSVPDLSGFDVLDEGPLPDVHRQGMGYPFNPFGPRS